MEIALWIALILQGFTIVHLFNRVSDSERQIDYLITQQVEMNARANLHAQWINSLHLALFNRKGALKEK